MKLLIIGIAMIVFFIGSGSINLSNAQSRFSADNSSFDSSGKLLNCLFATDQAHDEQIAADQNHAQQLQDQAAQAAKNKVQQDQETQILKQQNQAQQIEADQNHAQQLQDQAEQAQKNKLKQKSDELN